MKTNKLLLVAFLSGGLVLTSCGDNGGGNKPPKDESQYNFIYERSEDGQSIIIKNAELKESFLKKHIKDDVWDGTKSVLEIPETIDGLPVTQVAVDNSIFVYNSRTILGTVTMPNTVTKLGQGGYSVNDGLFDGCTALESVQLSTSLTEIGRTAFWGCTSLESIEIPSSVKSIGSGAFASCTNLTSLEWHPTYNNPIIHEEAFFGTNLDYSKITHSDPNKIIYCKQTVFKGIHNLSFTFSKDQFGIYDTGYGISFGDSYVEEFTFDYPTIFSRFTFGSHLQRITFTTAVSRIETLSSLKVNGGLYSIKDLYYQGTRDQWNAITKDDGYNIKNGEKIINTVHCSDGNISL